MNVLTLEQLTVLCEIAGINHLFGIELREYMLNNVKDQILEELKELEYIVDGELTEYCNIVLQLLVEYSNAKSHFLLNNTYYCQQKDHNELLIGINELVDELYIIGIMNKEDIVRIIALLKEDEDNLVAEGKDSIIIRERSVLEIINAKVFKDDFYCIKTFNDDESTDNTKLIYTNNGYFNIYDNKNRCVLQLGESEIYGELIKLF